MSKSIKENISTPIFLERSVAFSIDLLSCFSLSIIPSFGWVLALAYFLLKDANLLGSKSSIGKSIYSLRIVDADTQEPAEKGMMEKTLIRNLILVVPLLNILDIFHLMNHGVRLADQWTGLTVVRPEDEKKQETD